MNQEQLQSFLQEYPAECLMLIEMIFQMNEEELQQLIAALQEMAQSSGQAQEQEIANENLFM